MVRMADSSERNPTAHFGRQVRKERMARGWTTREFSARTGIDPGNLSKLENGKRPPTEKIALACDAVFPERDGWFSDYYEELRTWAPPGFRDWPEYENKTTTVREWSPMIITGMLQTEAYAHALLSTLPGVTAEVVAARLASRMERQRRVLFREDPPHSAYVIDHAALYRCVGSPEIMAEQMTHLSDLSALLNVTLQVLPAVACPATQGGFLIADGAVYAETVAAGYVYTGETVTTLTRLFDALRAECYRASESLVIIQKAGEIWTGESRATAGPTGGTASKSAEKWATGVSPLTRTPTAATVLKSAETA